MNKIKFLNNQKVRHFDVVLHKSLQARHFELIMEFIKRGVLSPCGGSSGPYFKKDKVVEGYNRHIFMLDDTPMLEHDETIADEYIRRMNVK